MSSSGSRPLRIVSIGGGTGLSTLLRGLKRYAKAEENLVDITAVVTVTDDGGSSGRLRREFDVLPPGDIRNCMVALSGDESLLSRLFQYRFASGRGLKGHSFGNLFLTAMAHLTGDFSQAVKLSAEVLAVFGRIFPSTAANVVLEATLADGTKVKGETRISRSKSPIERLEMRPRRPKPLAETIEAIAAADLITFGPGSLYTSIIPNLLVDGIPRAIATSPALKAYFVNLMSQPGETTHLRASDHVTAILRHAGRNFSRSLIDVCVVNTAPIGGTVLRRYQANEAKPVENDLDNLNRLGLCILTADLLRMSGVRHQEKIRHDPGAIAGVAVELAQQGRRAKLRLTS
ncbi:MAG: uridine diphosphate-N-acetylglucosamine-binding protein YvcK [Bryobacteraceae bacterium]